MTDRVARASCSVERPALQYSAAWRRIWVVLVRMMHDKGAEKQQRAMQAVLQMDKIDIADLERAYDG
jgi:hypothetical protein